MDRPAISVVMSVYNGERFLAEAIDSVLSQTFADFEFLILDDGSSDGSAIIIERFATLDPRIRPIYRENRGLVASLNQLLAEARAPVIARMDADDIAYPYRFERQLAFLEANTDYGVISSLTDDIDTDGLGVPYNGPHPPTDHEAFLLAVHHGNPLCHPSAMYRRDLVLGAEGYRRAFKHCEDYDLWLRLADLTKLCSLPEALLKYRRTDSQVSNVHIVEQQTNAAISYFAWLERRAGRSDPTSNLEALPALEHLDDLFGRTGVARAVRAKVARGLIYSSVAMRGKGFEILLRHVREGGRGLDLWKTVSRLAMFGERRRAIQLAWALVVPRGL